MLGEAAQVAFHASAGLPKMRLGRRTKKIVATEREYLFTVAKSVGRTMFPADVAVEMDYGGRDSEIATRTVWVKSTFMFGTQVYLHGFCEHRRKDRTFRFTRATRVVLKDRRSDVGGEGPSIPMALGLGPSFDTLRVSDFFVSSEIWGDLRRPLAILLKKMVELSIPKSDRYPILLDFSFRSLKNDRRVFAPTIQMATGACILIDRTDLGALDWKREFGAMRGGRFDKVAFNDALDRVDESNSARTKNGT